MRRYKFKTVFPMLLFIGLSNLRSFKSYPDEFPVNSLLVMSVVYVLRVELEIAVFVFCF